jgi:hypothetical protein
MRICVVSWPRTAVIAASRLRVMVEEAGTA